MGGKWSRRTEVEQPDDPSTRYIALTKGQAAIVDADDYEWLMQWKWQTNGKHRLFYASTVIIFSDGLKRRVRMHRLIMGLPLRSTLEIDHQDRDGLNNRKANLRFVTKLQQAANRGKYTTSCTSQFKGVCYKREGHYFYWLAALMFNGNRTILRFNTEEDAARAYDAMAYRLQGTWAKLNFDYNDGEVPTMPPRIMKKRGVKPGTRWKWNKSKRKTINYPGEENHGPRITA